MTSFHIPDETETREHLKALDGGNVIPMPSRVNTAAAALLIAEMNRKMCLEAAATYVEILRDAVMRNPENVTPTRMVKLLGDVAASIRELKDPDCPNGGAAA